MVIRVLACAIVLAGALAWQPSARASWDALEQGREQPSCVTQPARLAQDISGETTAPALPAGAGAWSLAITSSGGFTGRGAGNLDIDSGGAVRRWGRLSNPGSGRARADLLQPLATAVTAAQPGAWRACYVRPGNPDGCCDLILYTLTLRRRVSNGSDETYRFSWYTDSAERPPSDARAIIDEARKLTGGGLGPVSKPRTGG